MIRLCSLTQWTSNPWLELSSLLIGVLGIGIALITYSVSRKYKRLWYAVRSFTLVRRERATLPGLQVLFERKPVEALTVSKIALWNSGRETVRSSDFAEREPLSFRANKAVEILEAFVIQTTSSSCGVNVVRRTKNSFEIIFEFLEQRDGFVILAAHSGTSSQDVEVIGRIVGGRKIARREPTGGGSKLRGLFAVMPKSLRGARWFLIVALAMIGLIIIVLAFVALWIPGANADVSWLGKSAMVLVGLLYLGISVSIYRRRTPKGLERFDDEFGDSESDGDWGPLAIPIAPQFASRAEATDWVISQVRVLARNAEFTVSKRSDHELELDFNSFWLTLDQVKQIRALGEKNGFRINCKGRGMMILASPEMKEGVRLEKIDDSSRLP